jgi:hypothetical protein
MVPGRGFRVRAHVSGLRVLGFQGVGLQGLDEVLRGLGFRV